MKDRSIEKKYYPINEAAKILNLSPGDLLHLGTLGKIKLSAYFFGWAVKECEEDEDEQQGKYYYETDCYFINGIKEIEKNDLILMEHSGKAIIDYLRINEYSFNNITDENDESFKQAPKTRYSTPKQKIPEEYVTIKSMKLPVLRIENLITTSAELDNLKNPSNHKAKQNQIDKELCQAVARTLWYIYPTMTIEAITKHKAILNYANGSIYTGKNTLRDWIREVDPRPKEQKIGRPKQPKNTRHN